MFTEKSTSNRSENTLSSISAKMASGFALAILLTGMLHATPIVNLESGQLSNSKQLANPTSVTTASRAPLAAAAVNAAMALRLDAKASASGAMTGCTFTGGCYKIVEVPEPQSLLMVGTGLLSMAGMIRRRLLR